MNELADNVTGIVRSEKHDGIRNVFRLGQPPRREPLRQLGKLLFGVPESISSIIRGVKAPALTGCPNKGKWA